MVSKNHRWFLRDIKRETDNAITIRFDTNKQPFNYKPGQFVNVTLTINGEAVTRSYSLSSSPGDKFPSITLKRVVGGSMSNYLFDNASNILEWDIEGPYGSFILNSDNTEGEICFLGGGSGITPLFSMMNTVASETTTPFYLIYANRNPDDIIFKTEIEALEMRGKARVFHALTGDDSSEGFGEELYMGRLTRLIVKKLIKQKFENPLVVYYYICGPSKLMEVYKEAIMSIGVPEKQIFTESFTMENGGTNAIILPNERHEVLMHVHEITSLIDVKPGQSLLDSALENGLPVKYSCKNGTCGTCWGTYSEGEVKMVKNFALTKEEVEQNYILLCQSYPLNNNLTVHVG